ncbi:MAG: hypothetical protein FD189_2453 [Elusimicrobia bacterium]|nr:MAG: hypothetical protein FD154_2408 [Elusimicrobiota bacterium]KAF0152713.1 MAG: hypothetical protein FD189_2453 [Elusimicrobiota bacterium]
MSDIKALLEVLLLAAIPLLPIIAGRLLLKRFPKTEAGAEPVPGTRAGRLIGNILFWCGILAILMILVFILNYKGVI